MVDKAFTEALEAVKDGTPVQFTPRELLSWWGAARRGRRVVEMVRKELKKKKVTTEPDFDSVYIDAPIMLIKAEAKSKGSKSPKPRSIEQGKLAESANQAVTAEPAHRINRLYAANREPLCVRPNDSLELAVTLMLQNDYSQIPVMTNKSKVAGMISWRSIAQQLHVGGACKKVEECLERAYEVPTTASLFEASRIVAEHDAVLVRAENNLICGIVTSSDISLQFGALAEPFLLLGDIENMLRCLIERSFSLQDLREAIDPADGVREVNSVSDLTFGEYLRLVEKPDNWAKLGIPLDRPEVVKKLESIREIRNDVMHFDPDPLDAEALDLLRSFSKFLGRLTHVLT